MDCLGTTQLYLFFYIRPIARIATVCVIFLGVVTSAMAETRALLVGVSDYDNTIGLADLRGPANDVRLLRKVLNARGVKDIRVLADGVDGANRPTRDAIMKALKKLTLDSDEGDLSIIHFSGHGTRQLDGSGDEQDGFDEVFLPSDVARAPADTGLIPNAILDEEIGAAVRELRSNGVDVWTIMDFCHAGTGLRSGGTNSASRYVDPAVLVDEIKPASASGNKQRWFSNIVSDDQLKGGLVAFYAAQAHEVAREVNFTTGDENQGENENGWYGLFTSKIANRLHASPGITYRQLFQSVLADMNDTSVPGGARLQTPSREGNLFEATVLGGARTAGVRQYPVSFDELQAGKVHGLTKGTVVELFSDAAAGQEDGLGFAQVEEARTLLSFLRPVDDSCRIDGDALCASSGEIAQDTRFARIVLRPNSFGLSLSAVINLKTGAKADEQEPAVAALTRTIGKLKVENGLDIQLSEDAYTVEVAVADGKLWFGHNVIQGGVPVGLAWDSSEPEADAQLASLLLRMLDAERIAATMDTIAESGSPLSPSPVDVTVETKSSDAALLEKVSGRLSPVRECRRIQRREAYSAASPLAKQSLLKQCDVVQPTAQASEQGQFDINTIHIDSQFCARAIHTRIDGANAATLLGSPMIICSDCPGGLSTGNERLYVLKTKAVENADQVNLSQVLSTCDTGSRTRSAQGNALQQLIRTVGRKHGTRGAFGGMAPGDVWVTRFEWNVLPRDQGLRLAVGQ